MNQVRLSNRKPPSPIIPSYRSYSPEPVLSPTSPLERNSLTPRGWKKRESDGIGLAIVASLEKSQVYSPVSIVNSQRGKFEVSDMACSGRCSSSVCGNRVAADFRVADFLSHCYLCRKRLHGEDIYMYRGEKAFCSMDCRYQQIVNDEYQEKCGSEMSKTTEIAGSPYTSDRIFFTGIVTA